MPSRTKVLYVDGMAAKRSMITFATDQETKERIRSYAEAAGVDVSTYVIAAVGAAMALDDQVARTFAPLDDLIAETEAQDATTAQPLEEHGRDSGPDVERAEISAALDSFFGTGAGAGHRGVA
jgi:antitoxin component of RelBE/YafQ-DinJ toxin-antitoxin module